MSNYKHGMRRTRVYRIWTGMLSRCRNPNEPAYPRYGGRGITVCERWLVFENFFSDMGDPKADESIERLDNDAGYENGNCVWASRKQQNRNRSCCRWIEIEGVRRTVAEWAELLGVPARMIRVRLNAGWPERDAVLAPKTTNRKGIPRGVKLRFHQLPEHGVRWTDPSFRGAA